MTADAAYARRAWQLLEPVHAVVYFAPEPLATLAAAGFRGYWMGYFAARAAPLESAGPDVVHALFANFDRARVARALPAAWRFVTPAAALDARLGGSTAALRRTLGDRADGPGVEWAADLAERAARHAPPEGRALFAANSALPWPSDPLARLWHAATLLREHRGDGHVAALLAAGIEGRDAHVLHALAAGTPRETYRIARDLDDDEWDARIEGLADRGLATWSGAGPTDAGAALWAEVERRTDLLAAGAYTALTRAEAGELLDLLLPIARAVVAAGDIPLDSPMGLDLRAVG